MTGRVYILFLPFRTSPVVLLSTFARRSRYAGIPIFLCALLWSSFSPASEVDSLGIREFRTETGEQRAIPLADGSTIFLDVESTLRIPGDEVRKVYLDEGQAAFEVVRDSARPFAVQINQTTVQTAHSNFHVRRRADLTIVSIIEGEVRVVSATTDTSVASPKSRSVSARGRQLTISPDGAISQPVDTSRVQMTLWRERRLAFRHHTLAEIADEFNRYNKSPKLRVDGESLRLRTFSGVIDAHDPQTLLDYLAIDERIGFNRDDPDLIIISFRSRYGFARVGR